MHSRETRKVGMRSKVYFLLRVVREACTRTICVSRQLTQSTHDYIHYNGVSTV